MLDIQVNEMKDGKGCKVDLKVEGSAYTIAQELHIVMKHITEKVPEVAERLVELISDD